MHVEKGIKRGMALAGDQLGGNQGNMAVPGLWGDGRGDDGNGRI